MPVSTGLKKLDKILGGGLPENSVVLLSGGAGTGKTLLSLKFIMEGARKGEKCCFVSLSEGTEDILRACSKIESLSGIKKYLGKNLAIEHIPLSQSNVNMERFVDILSRYPEIDRLVIDNVNKMLIFSDTKKSYRAYLGEIASSLRRAKSSLLLCETSDDKAIDSGNYEAYECDGVMQIMFMELEEKPKRALSVHKMRYTAFEPKIPHEININSKDITMTENKFM